MPLRTIAALFGGNPTVIPKNKAADAGHAPYQKLYELLRSFYWSDVYADLTQYAALRGVDIHPIRNPTFRIIEFYARHMWPGRLPEALPIETENDRLIEGVHLLWKWSNWTKKKQVMARENPLLGDTFIQAAMREDGQRVFLQLKDPGEVVDFRKDERENITWIHLETPFEDGTSLTYLVEEWSKEDEVYRRWETKSPAMELDLLPVPDEEIPLRSMGIDFIPFVHAAFRDVGEERGTGAISLSLRKIWEADLIATALHQRLFRYNKPDVVLAGTGRDDVGRPPPAIHEVMNSTQEVNLAGETLWALPSGWDIRHWIANIDYASALSILQDHMNEIENDNPELAYYRIREMNQVSGRAVRMLLTDAIATIMEARGNCEDALIRAQQMALTMMASRRLIPDVGSYDRGDLEHSFEHRDIFPLNDAERSEERRMRALADATLVNQLGWSNKEIQREWGLDEETIQRMSAERDIAGEEYGGALLRALDSGNLG